MSPGRVQKDVVVVPIRQLFFMLTFAGRYAYDRSSTVPSYLSDWVMMYAQHFDVDQLKMLLRDVQEAQNERAKRIVNNFGCDQKTLADLVLFLEKEIDSRKPQEEINIEQ